MRASNAGGVGQKSRFCASIQGCRGYGDSHGDSHGYGYGMGMGIKIQSPRQPCQYLASLCAVKRSSGKCNTLSCDEPCQVYNTSRW